MVTEATGPIKYAKIDSTGTSITVVAAVSGKKIRVLYFEVTIASSQTMQWKSATTAKTGDAARTSWVAGAWAPGGHFETTAGEALVLAIGSSVAADGYVVYQEVS